ncbi:MAG: hypothetical protein EOO24_26025 [Comamonadaceae bacterium]|nr:MAG: hypothetical protein EOO24_26025 [Comamonadaceae bacterium]
MPDTIHSADLLLVQVERQLDEVDAGMLAADPTSLQIASIELRRASTAFASALAAALSAEAFDPAFRTRIEAVAQRLANQRESAARRNAVVERTLSSLMRSREGATYSVAGGRTPFGAAAGSYALGTH